MKKSPRRRFEQAFWDFIAELVRIREISSDGNFELRG